MSDSRNLGQFQVRFTRQMPQDLARFTSSALVRRLVEQAWRNGWRDAEWLATVALLGTSNDRLNNACGLFAAQLRDAAEMPCPIDETPIPPRVYVDPAPSGPSAKPEAVAVAVESCRKALAR